MAVKRIVGDAWVELHGKTDKLRKDIEDFFKFDKALEDKIAANLQKSFDNAFEKVDLSRYSDIDIDVDVDVESAVASLALIKAAADELSTVNVDFYIDKTGLLELEALKALAKDITVKVVPDVDTVAQQAAKEEIKDTAEKQTAEIEPSVDKADKLKSALELDWLTRDRFVKIKTSVDNSVGMQFARAFSGYRLTLESLQIGRQILLNLDLAAPKIATLVGGVSYLGGALFNLVADLSGVLRDTIRIIPILLPIPGIIVGLGLGIGGLVAAFKDFNEVIPNIGEEFGDLQDIISDAFWDQAKAPIKEFIDVLLPELQRVYKDTGAELGNLFANLANDFQRLFTVSDTGLSPLEYIFRRLNESISASSQYTEVFADMLIRLSVIGATYLPRLSMWVGDLITKFDIWLNTADISGFIETAITNTKYFGDALVGLYGIFAALGAAAESAGAGSLKSFSESLLNISDIMNGPVFQDKLGTVFSSANDMMKEIARISGPEVSKFFQVLAEDISYVFDTMGPALGEFIEEFAKAFSTPEFSASFREFIDGVAAGIDGFSDNLDEIGLGFGEFLEVVGAAVETLLPLIGEIFALINEWTEPLAGVFEALIRWVGSLSPEFVVLTVVFGKIISTITGLVFAVGSLGKVFGDLTDTIRVFRPGFEGFGSIFGTVGGAATGASGGVSKLGTAFGILSKAALPLMAITAGLGLMRWATEAEIAVPKTKDLATTLSSVRSEATVATDSIKGLIEQTGAGGRMFTSEVNTWGDALVEFGYSAASAKEASSNFLSEALDWLFSGDSQKVLDEQIGAFDDALEMMVNNGNWQEAAARFDELEQEMLDAGWSTEEIAEKFSQYTAVVEKNTDALGRWTPAIREARDAAREADEAFMDSMDATFEYEEVTADFSSVLGDINKRFAETTDEQYKWTTSLVEGTEAERAAFDATRERWQALKQVATATSSFVDTQLEMNGLNEDTIAIFKEQQEQLYQNAIAAGMAEEDARKYAQAALDIPADVITEFLARDNVTDITAKISDDLIEIDGETGTIFVNGDVSSWETVRKSIDDFLNEEYKIDLKLDGDSAAQDANEIARMLVSMGISIPADIAGIPDAQERAMAMIDLLNGEKIVIPTALSTVDTTALIGAKVAVDNANSELVLTPQMEITTDITGKIATIFDPITDKTYTTEVSAIVDAAKNNVEGLQAEAERPLLAPVDVDVSAATNTWGGFESGIVSGPMFAQVQANMDQPIAELTSFEGRVSRGVGPMPINADLSSANTTVSAWTPAPQSISVGATLVEANNGLNNFISRIRTTNEDVTISGDDDPGRKTLSAFQRAVDGSKGTTDIFSNADSAWRTWNSLYNSINGRTMTTYIRTVNLSKSADGNLFPSIKAFASGGLENHIAQISPPSSMLRVWAEPETGGEAYIPLALSKRNRSLEILEEVAKLFGYMLIPKMKKFAEGGILTSVPATSSSISSPTRMRTTNEAGTYYITVEINASDLDSIRSIEQFVQTVRRRTRQGIG